MNDDRSLERAARSFIEPGPTRAPEAAVLRALDLIKTTRQERDLAIPRRVTIMSVPTRVAAAAVVGLLAIGSAAFLLKPAPSGVGTISAPPSAPPPTSASSSSPGPTASSSDPIAEGLYRTSPMQVADIVAMIDADPRLTVAQRTHLIDVSFEIRGHKEFSVAIDFREGQWTQHQSVDGFDQIGARATYSFLDAKTLIVRDNFGLTGFEIRPVANGFSLKTLSAEATEEDVVTDKVLFESAPFIRVP
jgi:hypothetical protein